MTTKIKKICVVTGSRAEEGLLLQLIKNIRSEKTLRLQMLGTGTHLSKEDGYITKSLFHHLNESCTYLPDITDQFNDWINEDKYHWINNKNGRSHIIADVENFMEEFIYPVDKAQFTYTYNFDNCLSQDIQWISSGDLYQNNIIALCIHNGADARGGMTDYKFFKIDPDMFYMMDEEYFREDEEVA